MNQLKSIYNSLFKDSHSHPIHTFFAMIARDVTRFLSKKKLHEFKKLSVAELRGRVRVTRPYPNSFNFINFMHFLENLAKSYIGEQLPPPPSRR